MSAPITLVVSDVDGTLVDKRKQLTPGTIAAVARLRAAGVGFTIISARPRSGMMPILDALQIDDAVGAFNGGTIFRRDGTVLFQQRLDADVVAGIFALVGDAPVGRWVFADDRWYASDGTGPHTSSERITADQEPVVRQEFAALFGQVDKLTFVSDEPGLLADLGHRANAAFGDRATIVQSQAYYLDVTAPIANKGDGIAHLAKALDTPMAQVAAIGDQANDLPMFARAALSIAMAQGPAEVRAHAQFTTTANSEDGVAHAIDTIILPLVAGRVPRAGPPIRHVAAG